MAGSRGFEGGGGGGGGEKGRKGGGGRGGGGGGGLRGNGETLWGSEFKGQWLNKLYG